MRLVNKTDRWKWHHPATLFYKQTRLLNKSRPPSTSATTSVPLHEYYSKYFYLSFLSKEKGKEKEKEKEKKSIVITELIPFALAEALYDCICLSKCMQLSHIPFPFKDSEFFLLQKQ